MYPPLNALIFMKGHSARVPNKNLRMFCGRPLCHWILETLSASAHLGRIIVNTDSEPIAQAVSGFPKVKVHRRPAYLLGDHVVANPIIAWDMEHCEGEYFLQSHSTNPLLTTATVDAAIAAFFSQQEHDSLFSVTALQRRLYWADGRGINHDPARLLPTQELPPVYEENSCLYVFSRKSFRTTGQRLGAKPLMFPTPPIEAVDIDEESDFAVAEALMQSRLGRS